ncbi:MAG: DUF456 domain-containing protein [Nocardioides sp.]
MTATDVLVGLVILVGLVGILVPFLPGSLLVVVAIAVWATEVSRPAGWVVLAIALGLVAAGSAAKYALPHRRLRDAGIPATTQWVGVLLGVVGFFVVPVVGLLLGFVLGVYLAERSRVGGAAAGPTTRLALRSIGVGLLLEIAAATLAALVWFVTVVVI